MKTFFIFLSLCFASIVFLRTETVGQNAAAIRAVEIAILTAEDERRYDKTIADLLTNPNPVIRARAALAAGRIGDEGAVAPLLNLLEKDPDIEVREMAAFALGEIESISAADGIIARIREKKDRVIALTVARAKTGDDVWTEANPMARLVEAAGKIAAANATNKKADELRDALLDHLEAHTTSGAEDRGKLRLALTALLRAAPRDAKRTRPDRTDTVLARFLTHAYAPIRADAANAFARVRAKNANDVLRKMVAADIDPIARANAARALAAAEDKEAVGLLIKTATSDVDERVRVSAIRALSTLRDASGAEPLLVRGEALFARYLSTRKPGLIPAEQNELIEVATALGRLLTNTRNERAVNLFREIGKVDRGNTPEFYIARLRIAPGRGDGDSPELTTWRQYSTLGQVIGEFAALEPTNDEGKRMKAEAPDVLRPLAKAYAEADPVTEKDTIMAAPDVLRAFAKFKTNDLSELLRTALTNKDLFVRATAAELLAEQPVSDENLEALDRALTYAIANDTQYNDAVLGTLDAIFKLDKRKSLSALTLASGSLDHLVRSKVVELLKDPEFKDTTTLPPLLKFADKKRLVEVRPYSGKHTKLGQVLNAGADYRRALSRKNGSVQAVLTTHKGSFTIELLPENAPLTVDNFIKLASSGYFNGLEVHRLVPNFVMQDGDPRGDGNGGPGWSIRCEMNMVPFERGVVGMALSGKDTGGSQWFVTHSPQPHLDGGYTVFGRVNETGMKVVDKIVRGDKIISVRIVGK
jgi:cyclophilin family peptidyl-prolyl cis-trans isomerase/HEAT repeat protein